MSDSVFEKDDQQSSCVHMFFRNLRCAKTSWIEKNSRHIYVTEQGTGPTDSQASL